MALRLAVTGSGGLSRSIYTVDKADGTKTDENFFWPATTTLMAATGWITTWREEEQEEGRKGESHSGD